MKAVAIALLSLSVSVASAQSTDAGESDEAEARSLFTAGRLAYEDGRFAEALDLYQRSYDRSGRVELLYNIGMAADRLGEVERALSSFRTFLRERPDAAQANFVQARIGVLEELMEPDEPESRSGPHPIGWVLGATGVAAALVAVGTGARALSLRADLDDECVSMTCTGEQAGRIDTMERLGLTTDVLLGVAGALVLSGLLTLVLTRPDEESAVACGPTSCRVRVAF